MQDVGDVAVHEDVAGLEARDGRFGHARVGAAEPEDLGRLALGEGGEEGGRVLLRLRVPGFVAGEEALERVCGGRSVEGGWLAGGLREAVGGEVGLQGYVGEGRGGWDGRGEDGER